MDTRTLQSRLTARLYLLAGGVLVAVGVAAVVVTGRVLDDGDTEAARSHASRAIEALERELGEGDSTTEALSEVLEGAEAEGARLSIRYAGVDAGRASLPALAAGTCATVTGAFPATVSRAAQGSEGDGGEGVWRACAAAVARPAIAVVAAVPVGTHRAALRTLARGMAGVLVVALVAMGFAIRRAVRTPLEELDAVVRWTARIADAEPPAPPPAARTREIVQLQLAFDALVRRLFEALTRERASSAHMAHELRTPLTAIVAELQGLRARTPDAAGAVDRVLGDVARFGDVIEAILVLSAGQQPRGGADAVVNLADVAREMAPEGTGVDAPDEALVETDERLVRLALRNLLDNARKYASGPRVVRVSREGTNVRVAVVDDGPGLDAPARERMFERYWRGSADGAGRGLGLALVRAVAERYGGRAEARPVPGGAGLEVSMTFEHLVGWHDGARHPPCVGDGG